MGRLLILFGSVLLGLFVFQLIGILIFLPLFDFSQGMSLEYKFTIVRRLLLAPEAFPKGQLFLLLVQGVAALGAFIVVPYFYLRVLDVLLREIITTRWRNESAWMFLLVVGLVILAMPFNGLINYWNSLLDVSEYPFLDWMSMEEENRKRLTDYMTNFEGFGELFLGIVVISVIPGWAEEYLFRGILQNKLLQMSGNIHVSIWLSAFIFSAIHIQFFGFLPRMVLGGIFGYIYMYSGNLLLPILAHTTNNFVTLMAIHAYKSGWIDQDFQEVDRPAYHVALLSLVFTVVLLVIIYRHYKKRGLNVRIEQD